VIERDVDGAIDFDSGKVTTLPEKFSKLDDFVINVLDGIAWLEQEKMDAITEPSHSLKGIGIKANAVDKDAWDHLTPENILSTLASVQSEKWQDLDSHRETDEDRKTPVTWVFETREGGKGILQVLQYSEHGVKIRYKLVQTEKK
jgi:hypothetical protein